MLLQPVLAVLGLSVLCGLWVLFQRWVAVQAPEMPGVEDRCGSCSSVSCEETEPGLRSEP